MASPAAFIPASMVMYLESLPPELIPPRPDRGTAPVNFPIAFGDDKIAAVGYGVVGASCQECSSVLPLLLKYGSQYTVRQS